MGELYVPVTVCTEVLGYLSNIELMPVGEVDGFFTSFGIYVHYSWKTAHILHLTSAF